MNPTAPIEGPRALTLHLAPVLRLDDDQLFELCQRNRDLRIEREATGDLILMTPAGGMSAYRGAQILAQLTRWAECDGRGETFDSSCGFILPSGAMRAPDAAWVERSRLVAVPADSRERFLPLCPDFLVELRSPSDRLADLQAKMEEYLDNRARLGWLIDPPSREVHVYRPHQAIEVLGEPGSITGDPELPGFVLQLARIWEPGW